MFIHSWFFHAKFFKYQISTNFWMLFWQKIPNMIEVYHQKVDITDIKKNPRHSIHCNFYDSSSIRNKTFCVVNESLTTFFRLESTQTSEFLFYHKFGAMREWGNKNIYFNVITAVLTQKKNNSCKFWPLYLLHYCLFCNTPSRRQEYQEWSPACYSPHRTLS